MTSAGTMACAVCARVLSSVSTPGRYGFPGTQRWLHTPADEAADHPAVPVPVGQIRARHRCDFCSEDDPGWVLPARTFQLRQARRQPGPPATHARSSSATTNGRLCADTSSPDTRPAG